MASLPLSVPIYSISICKLILPCDAGKLAEAAAELKSANPPNGSADPPTNRRKTNVVAGLCKDPVQPLYVGFMKRRSCIIDYLAVIDSANLAFPVHCYTTFLQA